MDLLSSWADGPGCQRYVRVWGFMHRTWVLGPDEFPQGGGEQKPKARGREVGGVSHAVWGMQGVREVDPGVCGLPAAPGKPQTSKNMCRE